MHSCGKAHLRVFAIGAVTLAALGAPAAAQTAQTRYESAAARDTKLRGELANETRAVPAAELAKQVAQTVASFENVVRRYPASGYADNALWQAAGLSEAAYDKFNRADDRERALRFYRWLVKEYPGSPFVKQANERIAAVAKRRTDRATLTDIQRTASENSVRVVLELNREVNYREERLFGPARLFFDLSNVQLTPALLDAALNFPSDIVNKIRLGRHPDNVVRVVLDFEGVSKYSVFTLYSPFRLVIEAERIPGRTATVIMNEPRPVIPSLSPPAAAPPLPAIADTPVVVAATPAVAIEKPNLTEKPTAAPPPIVESAPPPPAAPSPTSPAANVAGGFSIARQLGLSVSRIVIDPGHGGHDPGVLGRGLTEAQLVLDVALRLQKLLEKEPGVEVVLTRSTDMYVPLEERTEIANRHRADMFLSIHANASRNLAAKGVETFFLSFASSPDAEAVAARENSASTREMHHLSDLVRKITFNNKLDESRDLASMVHDSLVANLRKSNKEIRGRGVKKAPFVVLIGAEMPSVLAEISFLSNRQELSLLKTAGYKQKIAESLYSAVMKYRKSLKTQVVTELRER
jgi:N-acetylmuramoyl-L-alanine amidase